MSSLVEVVVDGRAVTHRPVNVIAREIRDNWQARYSDARNPPAFYAYGKPYVIALLDLRTPLDWYYAEEGRGLILGFISAVGGWRGDFAKKTKAELLKISSYYE